VSLLKREIEPNIRERVFKAFIDLIILRGLEEQPMTGYKIIRLFNKKFGILPNSSMIYSNLKAMEKKKWIKRVSVENGKTYCLAARGLRIVNRMSVFTREIRDTVRSMMES
jgi:DNA-binding PadR family transcriptional regulator